MIETMNHNVWLLMDRVQITNDECKISSSLPTLDPAPQPETPDYQQTQVDAPGTGLPSETKTGQSQHAGRADVALFCRVGFTPRDPHLHRSTPPRIHTSTDAHVHGLQP